MTGAVGLMPQLVHQFVDIFFCPLHGLQPTGIFAGQRLGTRSEQGHDQKPANQGQQGFLWFSGHLRNRFRRPIKRGQFPFPLRIQRQQTLT